MCSTVLDPRFKKLAFSDNKAFDDAIYKITSAAARCDTNSEAPPLGGVEVDTVVEDQQQTQSIWGLFDERVTTDTTRRNPTTDAILEVRSYCEEPNIPRTADPLTWWASKVSIYPRLASVMTRKLCIVSMSVPSERVFSKSGQIVSERRNRLNPSKIRHLVFLNANLK